MPGTCNWIDRVSHAGFFGDDLLGPQGHRCRRFGWQAQGFIIGIRVEALCTTNHGSEGLDGDPCHVVERLLRGQADARNLCMESQHG